MMEIMEQLFVEKTHTLNPHEFKYCIKKLLMDKEPVTSIFNAMRSELTPDCISKLN